MIFFPAHGKGHVMRWKGRPLTTATLPSSDSGDAYGTKSTEMLICGEPDVRHIFK